MTCLGFEISFAPPATPRFNMPLELGLTITWSSSFAPDCHNMVFMGIDSTAHSTSSVQPSGMEPIPLIHSGTVEGVISLVRNAFFCLGTRRRFNK